MWEELHAWGEQKRVKTPGILAWETRWMTETLKSGIGGHSQGKDVNSVLDSVWSARADLSQKCRRSCVIRREMAFDVADWACRRRDRIWVNASAEAVAEWRRTLLFPCRVWNQHGAGRGGHLEMELLPWLLIKLIREHGSTSEAKSLCENFTQQLVILTFLWLWKGE